VWKSLKECIEGKGESSHLCNPFCTSTVPQDIRDWEKLKMNDRYILLHRSISLNNGKNIDIFVADIRHSNDSYGELISILISPCPILFPECICHTDPQVNVVILPLLEGFASILKLLRSTSRDCYEFEIFIMV
jgi:hypothetical protein